MRNRIRTSICAAGALALTGGASAQDWIEAGDAGEFPAEPAQPIVGCGPLETITGTTSSGDDDFVDAFTIRISDPAAFYATTSSAWDSRASAAWDTRLFLFDLEGNPVLANDDAPGSVGTQSFLSDPGIYPGDVDATAAPLVEGIYVLAVTGWGNDPEDVAGTDLFAFGTDFDHLFGPDPAAGGFDHWENGHGLVQSGAYVVALSGASYVPAGACPADIDASGDVGFDDLLIVLSTWGPCPGCPGDIDCSGDVGFSDLLAVLSTWGPCP